MMHLYTEFECQPENSTREFRYANFGAIWSPEVSGLGWMFAAGERFFKSLAEMDVHGTGVSRNIVNNYLVLQIAVSAEEILNNYSEFNSRRSDLISRFPKRHFYKLHLPDNPQKLG